MRKDKKTSYQALKTKMLKIEKFVKEYESMIDEHRENEIFNLILANKATKEDREEYKRIIKWKEKQAVITLNTIGIIINEK